jgi:hypothetical protein
MASLHASVIYFGEPGPTPTTNSFLGNIRTVGSKVPNYITLQSLLRWCCTFSLCLGDPMGQSRAFALAEVLLGKERISKYSSTNPNSFDTSDGLTSS